MLSKIIVYLTIFACCSCKETPPNGFVVVNSLAEGNFEIFNIKGDHSLQFISRQLGVFNKKTPLTPGKYLILADCSNEVITVHPHEVTTLTSHIVEFKPSIKTDSNDLFSVQCSRFEKIHSRQNIKNRFSFHVLDGVREMLVGMVPLTISPNENGIADTPKRLTFLLSSVNVNSEQSDTNVDISYFISPMDKLLSITQPQLFGRKQLLLPGKYEISLNGSKKTIHLQPNENLVINTGYLRIESSLEINQMSMAPANESPYSYIFNKINNLYINRTYSLLPGEATIQLMGSQITETINIIAGKLLSRKLKSLEVKLGCGIHEWECLGKRDVMLFKNDTIYPFLEGKTDTPILFNTADTSLSIEGSMGLKYMLPNNKDSITLNAGKVTFKPIPSYKPGYITDLVRLEANKAPWKGYSNDIQADQKTTMTLISGEYVLVRYTSIHDQERFETKKKVIVSEGKHVEIPFVYYLSENKSKRLLKKKSISERNEKKKNRERKYLNKIIKVL